MVSGRSGLHVLGKAPGIYLLRGAILRLCFSPHNWLRRLCRPKQCRESLHGVLEFARSPNTDDSYFEHG